MLVSVSSDFPRINFKRKSTMHVALKETHRTVTQSRSIGLNYTHVHVLFIITQKITSADSPEHTMFTYSMP